MKKIYEYILWLGIEIQFHHSILYEHVKENIGYGEYYVFKCENGDYVLKYCDGEYSEYLCIIPADDMDEGVGEFICEYMNKLLKGE